MASDLGNIKDEDLLRKMWQETEDFGRKKEIRAHMYKLREARLKEFYVNEMDPRNQQSFDSKAPITSRHGDAMADHSFESLKSNEIRGTDMSDIKFGNTGGWNVITSSEVSDDGKARTDKMLANTEGVTAIKGGQKAFSGKNEELKTERFDGDANNFTHTTGESSNMVLNENIVTGDEMNKRIESKSSSVSHTTKVIRSSTNTGDSGSTFIESDNLQSLAHDDSSRRTSSSTVKSSSNHVETQNSSHSNQQKSFDENVKLSQDPVVVQEALRLAQQPGTILSRKIERANESTNMITERKELSDGTIVTTKKYEPISSEHVDIQATTTTNVQRDSNKTTQSKQSESVSQTSKVTSNTTSSTTSRDEEAFRLAQQPGNIISRDVTMADANTRMITEKKELSDGTVVTTKRYEKVSNDRSDDSNIRTEHITKTSTNQSFKTSRDEEAFRLAQQPGKIISRDVTMANPTTRQIVEKKELNDGTIVTTKRFETVDSSSDTIKSTKITKEQTNDEFTKSLRNDHSTTTKGETIYKTSRDEEAFRLADQPGKVLSRDVTMANPTTRQIVEKKELHDGTIVTTKRFEKVDENVENVQNIKRVHTTEQSQPKKVQNDDFTTQREVVEETVTKKIFDTSCQCPSGKDKHDHKAREFIQNERDIHDITSEIITQRDEKKVYTEVDEMNRREEVKRMEQKRVDEQIKKQQEQKITRDLDFDSAHKAFASSLRCVTPPLDKSSTNRIDRKSPSRENSSSRYSSSTITTKKTSVNDVRKDENVKHTNSLDRRTSTKSQDKFSSLDRRSSSKSPEKYPSTERRPSSKSPEKYPSTNKDKQQSNKIVTEETTKVTVEKTNKSRTASPQKPSAETPRSSSPSKVDVKKSTVTKTVTEDVKITSREASPEKTPSTPRATSPQKSQPEINRSKSPQKQHPSGTFPRDSPSRSNSRGSSPHKQTSSLPRDHSPSKSKKPTVDHDESDTQTTEDILTATIKIDNIDKTINDLKIIQTIDSKNMSATTSVSDLEYISASDHKKMITDLDGEDIEVNISIQNVNELDDLQIKTTVSEIVNEDTKVTKKGDKKPLNRSETFEERAKKLIGVTSDTETKDVPNYLKPTKASQAPVKGCSQRVSEIRERKAKIEEIEKSSTVKRKSLTSATTDFIMHEKTSSTPASSPERNPQRRQSMEPKKSTKCDHESKSPERKKPESYRNSMDERKSTRTRDITDTVTTERKCSRSPTRAKTPETHITVAQITISPSRGITSKTVSTKTTTVQSNKHLKVAPHIKLLKQSTDVSSTEPESDRDTDQELIRNIEKTGSKSTRRKLLQTRKDTAPVNRSANVHEKEKVTRTFSEKIFKKPAVNGKDARDSPKKESKRPVKCIATKTINLTNVNGNTTTLHSNTLDNVEIDINVQHAKSSREPSPNKVVPIPVQTDEEVNEENILHPHKVTEPDDDVKKSKPAVRNVPIFQEETKQFVGLEITEVATEQGHTIVEEEEFEEMERIINSSTLEKADRKRNSIQIDPLPEDENDEHSHLLSVSQKVNKFNETVEELKKPKASSPLKKPSDFKLEDVPDDVDDDSRLSLNEKVSKFTKITDETHSVVNKQNIEETLSRSVDEVDENLKNDECLLSVSDKVNKFITKAEKIGTSAPQKSPELVKNIMKQTSKNVREKIENITESFLNNEKTSTNDRDPKSVDITLKSTEAIKKAREVFESNSSAAREINRQSDILSRPSVFEAKRTPTATRKVIEKQVEEKQVHERTPDRQSPLKDIDTKPSSRRGSSDRTPIYMKDQVSTKKDLFEKRISSSKLDSENAFHKPLSPQSSVEEKRKSVTEETHQVTRKISRSDKHYMQHTVASIEHVANTEAREAELHRTTQLEDFETRRSSVRSSSKQPSETREIYPESPKSPTKFGVELKKMDSFKSQSTTSSTARKVSIGSELINIEEIFELEELERLLEIVVGYEQRRRIRSQIRIVKKKLEDAKINNEFKARSLAKTSSRVESTNKKQVTERKMSDKIKVPRESVKTVTTTTTTTTSSRLSSDKEPKVVSKTTKVTTTASPRAIIETINKNSKGKATESVIKTARKTSATSSTQQKSSTMRESKTEVDCITSSYGVGPTDGNGMPLFGLKALKKKSPAVVESKTTGTVISEVSYSENGGPAVVQRKTTKYSTDPSDFSVEADVNVKSKSTTERKDSRGGIYSVTKVEKLESDKKSTPKVIRNGSVKELKEKFVRKDSSSRMSTKSETKRSSIDRESGSYSVSKTVKSTSGAKSFTNSDKKASNVKEVISYMKNADEVIEDGDTQEDAEARALLNKFFGASALMSTIENSSGLSKEFLSTGDGKNKSKSSASRTTTTKTVTSYSSSGSAKAHNINDIWDVDLLKKLLDSATNYDERRKIRERIRQVMADKEACAELVKSLTTELEECSIDGSSENSNNNTNNLHTSDNTANKVESTEEGESSLLLSLLPGILQNPKYRNLSARQILTLNLSRAIAQQSVGLVASQNSPTKMNNSEHNDNNLTDNNNDRLGHDFPIEDSGIESGEDLRLLAANIQSNLGNHMDERSSGSNNITESSLQNSNNSNNINEEERNKHVDTLGTDLLSEVTAALEKLQQSMNLGAIDLDESKKTALLSLVNRLQIGLISSEKKIESNIESADSAVSVTSPEINDTRRGSGGNIHRFNKRKNRANRHTVGVTREELADARKIIEELKFIDSKNVNPVSPQKATPVVMHNPVFSRQISEPVALMRPSQFVPKEGTQVDGSAKFKTPFKQSVSLDQPAPILKSTFKQENVTPIDRNLSGGSSINSGSNKFVNNNINSENDAPTDESSSSDNEDDMVNTKYYNGSPSTTQNGKFRAKENYLRNQQLSDKALGYSSGDESRDMSSTSRQPKYMSKKMKMKRATANELPKSYSFVNTFDLMDKDGSDNESLNGNNYQNRVSTAGLKTTFTGGTAPMPPKFTPKTENDKKFMAFIQKQNTNVVSSYVNPSAVRNEPKQLNWTNKFGNLKTKFEDGRTESPKPPAKASNAAANFWKNIEKDKPSAKVSPLPAVPIKNSQPFIKNLPVSTEKFPWKNQVGNEKSEELINIKKKPLADKFVPKEQPPTPTFKGIPEPNKLSNLKPANVNNFSHAPLSAFKPPISRKLSNSFKPIQGTEEVVKKTMPQIANGHVKQMAETGYNINDTSPIQPRKVTSSPTRSIASLDTSFVKMSKPIEAKTESAPWAAQPKSERVMSIATSKFENVPTVHLASHLEEEPIVRFRSNPLYNGTFEKRSSLPSNANLQFAAALDPMLKNKKKENTNSLIMPKDATFVITDFTQPSSVSTFAPHEELPKIPKPTLQRQDSLTNPSKEPLVLTCDRTVISPREPKPMEFHEAPLLPSSPHISNDNSIGSICDDLEHELDDLGESIECQAAVSKVMKAPVAQTAFTQSSELTSLNGQKKENVMIQSLHDSLKKLQQKSPTPEMKQIDPSKRLSQDSSNSSIDLKLLKMPAAHDTHNESHSRLSQDSSNSSIECKLPPLKIPVAAVPETAYSFVYSSPPRIQVKSPSTDPPPSHILYNNVATKVQPTYSLSVPTRAPLERSITPPGMYGVPQHVIDTKQKTVASYLGQQRTESLKIKPSPLSAAQPMTRKISLQVKPMMQVTKVSSKETQKSHMSSLARSKTMPSLAKVELLDESNIDDAFEELLSSSNL